MKKRTRKTTKQTKTPNDIVDVKGALKIVDRLDDEFEDNGVGPKGSVYRRIYREALELETRRIDTREWGVDSPALLKLITGADAFVDPVEAIRRAGFVQGYVLHSRQVQTNIGDLIRRLAAVRPTAIGPLERVVEHLIAQYDHSKRSR